MWINQLFRILLTCVGRIFSFWSRDFFEKFRQTASLVSIGKCKAQDETPYRLEVSPMDRKSKKHKQAKEPDKPKRKEKKRHEHTNFYNIPRQLRGQRCQLFVLA